MNDKIQTSKPPATGRVLEGVIVSAKTPQTVVVEVSRFVLHPRYGKFIRRSKRYLAHYEGETPALGARVRMVSGRPRSRRKTFVLL